VGGRPDSESARSSAGTKDAERTRRESIFSKYTILNLITALTLLQYEMLRDVKALNELRELLVIIRIWGLLRPTCLPVFVQIADNLDVLALCFKLLSRLVQTSQSEPDEALIGEY
jgi:hypothetical protein